MLYPPYIDGTLPAFYGTVITVPFSQGQSVSQSEVTGFSLKIKNISSSKYLLSKTTTTSSDWDFINGSVKFSLSAYDIQKLTVGQHYKVQIAYIDNFGAVGYYSTVGIIKYTEKPQVTIKDLERKKLNPLKNLFIGQYSQEGQNYSEKVYKYKFIVYDAKQTILEDTGWLIHNSLNDDKPYNSYDSFNFRYTLQPGEGYYIQYKVITNNGLEEASPRYRIHQQKSIPPDDADLKLTANLNYENGYIELKLSKDNMNEAIAGSFLISRTSKDSNFSYWEELSRQALTAAYCGTWSYKDFTIQQGKEYIYSIQQFNDIDLYSDRVLSNTVYSDFEHAFLFDGKRQLKIKYNPKVPSFKTTLLESKMDTVGSKYPFTFRNGNVEYKEFQLNGLISYLSDEEWLFLEPEEIGLERIPTQRKQTITSNYTVPSRYEEIQVPIEEGAFETQIIDNTDKLKFYNSSQKDRKTIKEKSHSNTSYESINLNAEREFKMHVLDWLNNGEPKLFRSPVEGNFLVRLINNSLTPEDTTGRMLHSFQSSAYEVAECNFYNLSKNNIIHIEKETPKVLLFNTVNILEVMKNKTNLIDGISNYAVMLKAENFNPQDQLIFQTNLGEVNIVIGATGSYEILNDLKIYSVVLSEDTKGRYLNGALNSPSITYGFYDYVANDFATIKNVENFSRPAKQFYSETDNLLNLITDIKTKILHFYYLHFLKKDEEEIQVEINSDYTYTIPTNREYSNMKLYKYFVPRLKDLDIWSFEQIPNISIYDLNLGDRQFEDPNFIVTDSSHAHLGYRYFYYKNKKFIPLTSKDDINEDIYIPQENGDLKLCPIYKKKNFELYFDPMNRDIVYITDKTYNEILMQVEELPANYKKIDYSFQIDSDVVEIDEKGYYDIRGPISPSEIKIGNGVMLECGYEYQIIEYKIESTEERLIGLRRNLDALEEMKNSAEYNKVYKIYIDVLTSLKGGSK